MNLGDWTFIFSLMLFFNLTVIFNPLDFTFDFELSPFCPLTLTFRFLLIKDSKIY